MLRATQGMQSCALPASFSVANQEICQLQKALEALNQCWDFSGFFLPKLYLWWIYWESGSLLRWRMH